VTDGWHALTINTIIRGFSKCGFLDPPPGAKKLSQTPLDATEVVEAMANLGMLESAVGEISDAMDVLESITEVVVSKNKKLTLRTAYEVEPNNQS
jgi:hypothetical protein